MSPTSSLSFLAIVALAIATSACVEPPADGEPVPDDTVFFVTAVTVSPDGAVVVSEPRAITAGEQRAQNERRLAIEAGDEVAPFSGISQDFGCASDSFWLYSYTNCTGQQICFRDPGYLFLANYNRYVLVEGQPFVVGTWEISSGCYWPGKDGGEISRRVPWYNPYQSWYQYFWRWSSQTIINRPSPATFLSFN